MIYLGERLKPGNFLGKWVKVALHEGAIFNFKIVSLAGQHITGVDADGLELTINLDDIDFIVDLGAK